jgi:hypothetical protein
MKRFLLAPGLFLLASAPAAFADAPDPGTVFVRQINFAGTGCPAGSVAGSLSPDQQAFTLLFDSFVASAGPGVPITEGRKNCSLDVQIHYPAGWTFSLATVDYRGYGLLDAGVTGLQQATYFFQGELDQTTSSQSFSGEMDQDYVSVDVFPVVAWAPCNANRNLEINAEVRVNNRANRQGQGELTIDSINGKVEQIYGVQWARCPNAVVLPR